jgi:UDP-N-acetyl-D-glucosamine dehydrogenase
MTGAGARVAVIGQGYVGLPASCAAVAAGHTVVGFDLDADKVAALAAGYSPIDDVTDADVAAMLATGRYLPSADPDDLTGFEIAVIAVPTPLHDRRPDLSAVLAAAGTLAPRISRGSLVVLESTVAPGTTAGEFLDALRDGTPLVPNLDFQVAFSPERIDPGNAHWDFRTTPKLVAGIGAAATDAACRFYETICDTVVRCSSTTVAEMAKLLENTYRYVNIALVNELGRHAHELGVSIWEIIDAAKSKPYGYQAFYPGPGVGGHCLPVDPAYLSDRVERTLGHSFDFIDLAMRVNDQQPEYVVNRIMRLLNREQRAVNGASVLILGMAYKPGIGDMREAPTARIVTLLRELGAEVWVCDPCVADLQTHLAGRFTDVKVIGPAEVTGAARSADLTVLTTDHDDFPYDEIRRAARLIFDTRNRFAPGAGVHHL